jgi:hypothetical protein
MVRSHFATTTGWQRFCFCPPSQRRSGAGPSSPREKPNLHRQRECAVKCSCGSVLSGSPFSSVPYTVRSVAKAQGHCLSNIAHLARCSVHWELWLSPTAASPPRMCKAKPPQSSLAPMFTSMDQSSPSILPQEGSEKSAVGKTSLIFSMIAERLPMDAGRKSGGMSEVFLAS